MGRACAAAGRSRRMSLAEFGAARLPPLAAASVTHPRIDRRGISLRWLGAVSLVGLSGGSLMVTALLGCLSAHAPARPRFRRPDARAAMAGDGPVRADRLTPSPPPGPADRTRVEQLGDGGSGVRPFTHLFAHLGRHPTASIVASTGPAATKPALPPEILFGQSQPVPAAPTIAAYAETPDFRFAASPPPMGEPLNVSTIRRQDPRAPVPPCVVVDRPGDSVAAILAGLGVSRRLAAEAEALLVARTWSSTRALEGGETMIADIAAGVATPWRIRLTGPGRSTRAVALADDGHYRAVAVASADPAASTPVAAGGSSGTLRDALAEIGTADDLDPGLVAEAGRLCGHDLDLDDPVSAADTVEMLFAADAIGQPELAFLGLTVGGRRLRYYRFTAADDGSTDYYDRDGRSVTRFLLRKPVASGRLGDGFGWRIHPVLGDRRFHQGVDYAAPYGSPIAAAGAGVVEKIDQEWGYGKYIRIRHDLGYETTYAHIAGVPRGITVGQLVCQGQTVAFIGSTGLSTGPHLYYEVRVNGRNVDPLRVRLAGGRMLRGAVLDTFTAVRQRVEALLSAGRPAGAP